MRFKAGKETFVTHVVLCAAFQERPSSVSTNRTQVGSTY